VTARRVAPTRTTVAQKAAMAVSGLILVGYLLAHMYGNLKLFSGQQAFDDYSHHLRELGEPLLPHTGALWIIRVVLLASVLIHMVAAYTLWRRASKARTSQGATGGRRYHTKHNKGGVQRSYASFTLRWGGVIIILFVIYHLLHLTWNVVTPGGASESPYRRTVEGFEIWWVVLSYTIAMAAVGFHLRHGIFSASQTLGYNTARRQRNLNRLAIAVALIVTVGFLIPPYSVLFDLVN
jgi:succinate dehydrogenase / fumarate reductase cytochrome b subunit